MKSKEIKINLTSDQYLEVLGTHAIAPQLDVEKEIREQITHHKFLLNTKVYVCLIWNENIT